VIELRKVLTQNDMTLYSGPGNIHSDLEVAKRTGLRHTVAQGMMTMAYASELLARIHGDAWIERGEMSVKFVGLVYAGDEVTIRVDGEKVEAVNQRGEPVMVGEGRLRL
jgi:acyl dehydratase